MYGKIFASTFTGSMMVAGSDAHAVWCYVIANAVDSQVELNPLLLAAVIGAPPEAMERAIAYLCAEDPNSRSKAEGGRRLVREGQFAYRVVNHGTYRGIKNEDERREYNRIKKAESRQRLRQAGASNPQPSPDQGIVDVKLPVNDNQRCQHIQKHKQIQNQRQSQMQSQTQDQTSERPDPPPADAGGSRSRANAKSYPEDFLLFWAAYPRRVSKGDALKAWKEEECADQLDAILAAVEAQKNGRQWLENGGRYVPYPATWLRARRWEDQVEPPPSAPEPPVDPMVALVREDKKYRNEPGFNEYKRAVLDGHAQPGTWDEWQKGPHPVNPRDVLEAEGREHRNHPDFVEYYRAVLDGKAAPGWEAWRQARRADSPAAP